MRRTTSVGAVALILAVLAIVCVGAHPGKPVVRPASPIAAETAPPARVAWMQLAPTPPMGWNSWNKFGCNVSEQLIRETADAIVSTGMKDAGYQYVVIDDCWQVSRDASGNIVADPQRFQ